MSMLKKALVPSLFAIAAIAAVPLVGLAQQATPPAGAPQAGDAQKGGFGGRMGQRTPPSPETMQRMLDGRIAGAKTTLKLNDAQLKLFAPIEELVRKGHADRLKRMQEFHAQRGSGPRPDMALPDRLDRMSQMMAERATRMKEMADAVKPLFATLSDEQKAVLGPAMRQLGGFGPGGGMRGHGGHRWAGRGGHWGGAPQ